MDKTNNTITLKDDVTWDSQGIEVNKKSFPDGVTIDLNGHTAVVTGDFCAIYNYDADVTVKNGTIKMKMAKGTANLTNYAVCNLSGTMTIENLVVEGDLGALFNAATDAKMTVISGTFRARQFMALYNSAGTVVIKGGTFDSDVYNFFGSVSIENGVFNSAVSSSTSIHPIMLNGGKFKTTPGPAAKVKIRNGVI